MSPSPQWMDSKSWINNHWSFSDARLYNISLQSLFWHLLTREISHQMALIPSWDIQTILSHCYYFALQCNLSNIIQMLFNLLENNKEVLQSSCHWLCLSTLSRWKATYCMMSKLCEGIQHLHDIDIFMRDTVSCINLFLCFSLWWDSIEQKIKSWIKILIISIYLCIIWIK